MKKRFEVSIGAKALVTIHHERLVEGKYVQVGEDETIPNILTDRGRVSLHTFVYGTSAQRVTAALGSGFHYMALSDNATIPAASDTALAGELTIDGLQRALSTVTLPTGAGVITEVYHMFTYLGAGQIIQKTCLFDAASGGNMLHEVLFSPRTLFLNDKVALTFRITIT